MIVIRFAKFCLIAASILGAGAVGLGAFGAHGLQEPLARWYPEAYEAKLATWNTAVTYQFYHALALLALGAVAGISTMGEGGRCSITRWWRFASWFWLIGVIIFSGMLYLLVLSDLKWLGAIVPIGGVLMILGWLAMGVGTYRLSLPNGK